jgi:hypothetical protein
MASNRKRDQAPVGKKKKHLSILRYYIQVSPIQSVPGGKFSILGDHSIGHSKQKFVYVRG